MSASREAINESVRADSATESLLLASLQGRDAVFQQREEFLNAQRREFDSRQSDENANDVG